MGPSPLFLGTEDGEESANIVARPALILKAIGKDKGSGKPNLVKVGTITKAQIKEIAAKKMQDLNANDIDAAAKIIAGTARQMGVDVK